MYFIKWRYNAQKSEYLYNSVDLEACRRPNGTRKEDENRTEARWRCRPEGPLSWLISALFAAVVLVAVSIFYVMRRVDFSPGMLAAVPYHKVSLPATPIAAPHHKVAPPGTPIAAHYHEVNPRDTPIVAPHSAATLPGAPSTATRKYLIFVAPSRGQGIGNMLVGLYGSHAMAHHYRRILCIQWPSFNSAFEYDAKKHCVDVHRAEDATTESIDMYNWDRFGSTYDAHTYSATRRKILAGNTTMVYIRTSYYPLWWDNPQGGKLFPQYIPDFPLAFSTIYTPNAALARKLPREYPTTVIHLRMGDGGSDVRGLFHQVEEVWEQLKACLPKDGYLLSDQQMAYDKLNHLRHPVKRIGHSAIQNLSADDELETWAQWLLILHARTVINTPSGFSESAVRWARGGNVILRLIDITAKNVLQVDRDTPEVLPLANRTALTPKDVGQLGVKSEAEITTMGICNISCH